MGCFSLSCVSPLWYVSYTNTCNPLATSTLADPRIFLCTLCGGSSLMEKEVWGISRFFMSLQKYWVIFKNQCGLSGFAIVLLRGVCMCVFVCVYRNNLAKLALGELEGSQLHIGASQRFPVRSEELPEGIQYKQNSPILQGYLVSCRF